jgi:hypothetical protein
MTGRAAPQPMRHHRGKGKSAASESAWPPEFLFHEEDKGAVLRDPLGQAPAVTSQDVVGTLQSLHRTHAAELGPVQHPRGPCDQAQQQWGAGSTI